jgi:hypothetical protein
MDKTIITNFNKNKSKELYKHYLTTYFNDISYCRLCNNVIFYYDSTFKVSNHKVTLKGKSYISTKNVYDKVYHLTVCEDCLTEKYPEYQTKNKSRVFNVMNEITAFAYNIPYDVMDLWIKEKYAVTLNNLIRKYGKTEGEKKWKTYCEKQAVTNSFEYKKQNYGWTQDDFDEYNKNRSVTLENLIQRHGENLGLVKWNEYIEKQKLTKSKDYVVNKYGIDFWKNLCNSKAHTIENYLKRYGSEEEANNKLIEFYSNLKSSGIVSKSSQNYFEKLDVHLSDKYKTYFFNKNGKEYGKNLGSRWVYLDYYISELNLCIEYNGDLFHANPKHFNPGDKPIPFSDIESREIWRRDDEKITLLKEKYQIETIVIWESELPTIEELLEKIQKYET